jgi:hypothetical protein
MTTSEIFRQSARVRVVGVVTWWGFDLDDVVDDEGRFENSWIATHQLCLMWTGRDVQSISTDRTRAPSLASRAASGRPTTSDLP